MRILHAPKNIANQAWYATRALRRLGHEAEVWEYGASPFGFPTDRTIDSTSRDPQVLWNTFMEALPRFDVLHFHFAQSLFPNHWGGMPPLWDLPIYRILGKKVFFTFHGTDCRIRRIHEQVNPWSYYRHSDVPADDDRTEKTIQVIRTYANRMFVVSADYLSFVPEAEVVPRIIDLDEWPELAPRRRLRPLIVHAPSRRGTKGTDLILAGLEQLKADGVAFDLRLLDKVPHSEVRAALAEADIAIDNVLTGDYEMVSLEAMASGAVAVANLAEPVQRAFPDAPVHSVNPDTFVPRMRDLLRDVSLRASLAERGRDFVARHHDAPVVARQLLRHYEERPTAVPIRTFPDWINLADRRSIERLEGQLAVAEQELARAGARRSMPAAGRGLRDRLPAPLRRALRPMKRILNRLRAGGR